MIDLPYSHSVPDETIAHGLDYCRALGIIESWTVRARYNSPRHYYLTFPDGHVSDWGPGMALSFALGVRLATTEGAST